jgi:hypothetical protein
MKPEQEAEPEEIFTLHRYFIWASRHREHLEITLQQQGPIPDTTPNMSDSERAAIEQAARAWFLPVFFYGSSWLASLFVVVEGWQKLCLHDDEVDRLLDAKFLDLLRRNRNAIFHYQPEYLDNRVLQFVQGSREKGPGQARELHEALSGYFLRWFEARGELPQVGGRPR